MTTFEFLAAYGAARFGLNSGNPVADVEKWLNSSHPQIESAPRRPCDTWLIVSVGALETRQRFSSPEVRIVDEVDSQAFARHLTEWDGQPRCFISLDKKRLYLKGLFLTYDLRAVRICTSRGCETFDFTQPPNETSGKYHHRIWKWKDRA